MADQKQQDDQLGPTPEEAESAVQPDASAADAASRRARAAEASTLGGAIQAPDAGTEPPPMPELTGRTLPQTARQGDMARSAGRGGLAVAGAKVYFILTGLVQQIALKAVLGLEGYGALSSVLSAASITYNPIVATSIQGVSRAVAASKPEEEAHALRRTFLVHSALAVIVGGGFFLLAPIIGPALGAAHIVDPLRILSAVMFLYGLYTPLVGALNGKRRFLGQAGLDVFAATLRTIGLIGGAYWLSHAAIADWGGVEGASLGFVAGAIVVLGVALSMVGVGQAGRGGPSVRDHLAFITPLLFGQILLNVLFQADALLLRRFAADAAMAANLAPTAADPLVGAYRAAQLFCFLPYQLLLAVTFILFPMLATAHRDADRESVALYVQNGVRLALILAGLMVSVTSGLDGQLIDLVYGKDAADLAGSAMKLLSIGLGAFALFGIFTSVLNSLARERASALVTGLAVILVTALCVLRVPGTPFGEDILWRTAVATTTALIGATLVAGYLVWRTTGTLVPPLSVVRVGFAATLAIGLGRALPPMGKVMTLAYSAVVALVYVLILLIGRELGKSDLANVRAVVSRRR